MNVETHHAGEYLLTCPEESCGRRVVLKHPGEMVVIDRGDFFASHSASVGHVQLAMSMGG